MPSKVPAFFRNEDERHECYAITVAEGHALNDLPDSISSASKIMDFLNALSCIPFYSLDDSLIELMSIRGALMVKAIGKTAGVSYPTPQSTTSRRILATKPSLNLGPELASMIAHLLPVASGIDLWIGCYVPPSADVLAFFNKSGAQVFLLDPLIEKAAAQIVSLAPRVVLYMTNQSSVMNQATALGALRLAPIQIATTMSPVTTGLPKIDFYLTGVKNEGAHFQSRYTETPLLLCGDINHYSSAGLERPPIVPIAPAVKRDEYFFSGGNFNKYNAPLVRAWAKILLDSNCSLKLCPYNPNWQSTYARTSFENWVRGLMMVEGVDPSRVDFVGPFSSRSQVLEVVQKAKLYLDTFPYSGAVSVTDAIDTNTPFLCLAGNQARFKQGAIQALRNPALGTVSNSVEQYIDVARRIDISSCTVGTSSEFWTHNRTPDFENSLSSRVYDALLTI